MGDLLDRYQFGAHYDETFCDSGVARGTYDGLVTHLQTLSRVDLDERGTRRDQAFRDEGITFALSGQEERPFPLDLVPRILAADEWATIERGLVQRVRALEAFLADVYGEQHILRDGIVPYSMVLTSPHFHRGAFGFTPAGKVRVHVAGIDLVRDELGRFRVLEDNLRCPSGISYVVENRRAMTQIFPALFQSHRVRPVADYPGRLVDALRTTSPSSARDVPTVVVLTPGVHNSAYFEHSFLARQMGVPLVEGRDLVVRDRIVYMRTTAGEHRVDCIYRRIDDEFLDPLYFRPDSLVGCPGLLDSARAGNVTIANMVGNGVADDKAIYCYVPQMIDYYLGERPSLENVETYLLDDRETREEILRNLDQYVSKPVDGSGGYGIVIGPRASDEVLHDLRGRIVSNPRGWIAQRPVALSTSPTYIDGSLEPRHVDLRPFAVNDGEEIWVVPGGLTRVALPRGSLIVNSSQGGGSKDTWVLSEQREVDPHHCETHDDAFDTTPVDAMARRAQDAGPRASPPEQQQQQQQQSQAQSSADRC